MNNIVFQSSVSLRIEKLDSIPHLPFLLPYCVVDSLIFFLSEPVIYLIRVMHPHYKDPHMYECVFR